MIGDRNGGAARRLAIVGVAAALVVAPACGSDDGSGEDGPSDTTAAASAEPVDVCGIVTAEDAATVFGAPARTTEPTASEAGALGACLYEGIDDPVTVRNLLQMRVYDGEQYFGDRVFTDEMPLDVGDEGFVNVNEAGGIVDIQFVQDGRTVAVNYSAGPEVDVTTKVDAVEAIARQLSAGL
jgi:hypothetical protein